jgi:hypothetical protein
MINRGKNVRATRVDGLSTSNCQPITMDVSDGKLTWSDKNLDDLIGSEITLRFHLNKATLYSFSTK